MAAISSSYNIFFGTASWNDPSIWIGGIVPTASDDVMIQGQRFTNRTVDTITNTPNLAIGITYWTGSRDIVVYQETTTGSGIVPSNGFPFPQTGSLYTFTNFNELVKVDYKGYHFSGSGQGSVFRSCSVDTAFYSWNSSSFPNSEPMPSTRGGYIPYDFGYFFFQPGVISISGSNQVDIYRVTIQNGGKLHIQDSASIRLRNFIQVNDGELKVSGSVTIAYDNPWTGSIGGTITDLRQTTYISQSSYYFSTVEFVGPEVRLNTSLTSSANVGDSYLTVKNTSSFATGDYIFVGEDEPNIPRTDDGWRGGGYPQDYATYGEPSSEDEAFYVTGKTDNKIYVQRANGIYAEVLASSSATQWIVDDERFNIGDKVVINNQTATITNVEDYDLLLNDYDFTNPTASLANFETSSAKSTTFRGWQIQPGLGVVGRPRQEGYIYDVCTLVEKNVVRDKVKFEAWMYNKPPQITGSVAGVDISYNNLYPADYDKAYDTFGIFINSELSYDDWFGYIEPYESLSPQYAGQVRTYLGVNPSKGFYFLNPRYDIGGSTSQSLDLANVGFKKPNYLGLYKFGLEYSKGFIKGYINDVLVAEQVASNGGFWGRNGVWSRNPLTIITRVRTYAKCQRITLNTGVTASIGDTFYETGVEFAHPTGSQVIKLTSTITDLVDHTNLAYVYQGTNEYSNSGNHPIVYQIFAADTQSQYTLPSQNVPGVLRQESRYDSYVDLFAGTGFQNKNITIDLNVPTTFSNAGFIEYYYAYAQQLNNPINPPAVSGSLDAITWFPITGGIDNRQRIHYDGIRDWNFPPVVYRYVRFNFNGNPFHSNNNYIRSLFVRNFASGSNNPRLKLNNASDFNVGDQISILPSNQVNTNFFPNTSHITPFINANSSSQDNLDFYPDHYTVKQVSGSFITLDRIINRYPLLKGSKVVKLNRGLSITGSWTSGSYRSGQGIVSALAQGTYYQNFLKIKNVAFQHVNVSTPWTNAGYPNFGYLSMARAHSLAKTYFQGSSIYNTWNGNLSNAWFAQQQYFSHAAFMFRHNALINMQLGLAYILNQAQNSYAIGPKIFTGNVIHMYYNTIGSDNRAYTSFSYNILSSWDYMFGGMGVDSSPSSYNPPRFGYQNKYIIIRNFGMSVTSYTNTFYPVSTVYERRASVIIRNNGFSSAYAGGSTTAYSPDFAFTEHIWPKRGGLDFSTTHKMRFDNYSDASSPFLPASEYDEAGLPVQYLKNFNRWGYDIWTTSKGYWLKYPNLNYFKFYITGRDGNAYYRNLALLSAAAQVLTNTTSSFTINFDYYNSIDQITQLQYFPSQSLDTNLFPQNRDEWVSKGNNAGSLFLMVKKDGKTILPNGAPYELLPKSQDWTSYSKTFSFEGKGNYYVAIISEHYRGHIGFKGLDSVFKSPSADDAFLTFNAFTQKNFTLNEEKTIRKATTVYGAPESKFRLKGARLY
jgi:hypothetical protein